MATKNEFFKVEHYHILMHHPYEHYPSTNQRMPGARSEHYLGKMTILTYLVMEKFIQPESFTICSHGYGACKAMSIKYCFARGRCSVGE